jgi:ATP-binding cassette subfamily F protein 3
MLTTHHLTKHYDSQIIFKDITFSLNPGERVGLVGPNGCGKTTLIRILAGEEPPTEGHVQHDPNLRIGYLPQGLEPDPNLIMDEVISPYTNHSESLYKELEVCSAKLAQHPGNAVIQAQYDQLIHQISSIDTSRSAHILAGLGLIELDPNTLIRRLSGGQKTRLSLAVLLLNDPELLLLDEPTNHLDIHMLEWLESWLVSCNQSMLIVSHDRTFLDHTVERILSMDPLRSEATSLYEYTGNYSTYLEQRQAEIDKQWAAFNDQQCEIKRMKADITRTRTQAEYTERQASSIRIGGETMKIKGYKSYQQGIAKKVAKKAKSRETRLERYLDSDERVEKPKQTWEMHLVFNRRTHLSRSALHLEEASVGYDLKHPLLNKINLDVQTGQRIVISGSNGSGKTTLLRTLVGEIPLLAGELWLGTSTRLGYMSQDQSILEPAISPVETLLHWLPNETEVRNFLAQYLFTGDEPLKPNAFLSYGQRSRLMLALLVIQGSNLLLLDEPINHLDIPSRTQFEKALNTFDGAVLSVVHDRYFIERFAEIIWWVEDGRIKLIDNPI